MSGRVCTRRPFVGAGAGCVGASAKECGRGGWRVRGTAQRREGYVVARSGSSDGRERSVKRLGVEDGCTTAGLQDKAARAPGDGDQADEMSSAARALNILSE